MSPNTVRRRPDEELDASTLPRTDGGLVAYIEAYDDAPDECTIYPSNVSGDELVTRWITAQEGSYVDLADVR